MRSRGPEISREGGRGDCEKTLAVKHMTSTHALRPSMLEIERVINEKTVYMPY